MIEFPQEKLFPCYPRIFILCFSEATQRIPVNGMGLLRVSEECENFSSTTESECGILSWSRSKAHKAARHCSKPCALYSHFHRTSCNLTFLNMAVPSRHGRILLHSSKLKSLRTACAVIFYSTDIIISSWEVPSTCGKNLMN